MNVQKDKMRKIHAALFKTNHAYSTYNYSNNVKAQQQNNRYFMDKNPYKSTHSGIHYKGRERGSISLSNMIIKKYGSVS